MNPIACAAFISPANKGEVAERLKAPVLKAVFRPLP